MKSGLPVILSVTALLLAMQTFALEAEPNKSTVMPAPGSSERKLILDALRGKVAQLHGIEVVFVVRHLKVKDGWAWVHTLPQSPDGLSRYEDVSALLRKSGAAWGVVELPCAEESNDRCLGSVDYFRLLKERFPNVPADILPNEGVAKQAPSHAGKSILDYYHSLPRELLGDHKYRIESENNIFVSRSNANYQIKPIVDVQNGYLKITDAGTGGGSIVHELAFLQTTEGHNIIGVNVIENDGVGPICKLRFYRLSEDQRVDVTNDVLPAVDVSRFLDEKYLLEHGHKMDLHPEGISFVYALDIVGAPIFVRIDFDRFLVSNPKTAVSREFIKNIKYQNVKLIWDKDKNAFRFGEKATLVPSELMRKYLE